jgi:hypothetical protein
MEVSMNQNLTCQEVFLTVRVPDALRHAIRQRALDQRTSVAKMVNRLLQAELAKGSASAAVADRR